MKPVFNEEIVFFEKYTGIRLPDDCWRDGGSFYLNNRDEFPILKFKVENEEIIITKNNIEWIEGDKVKVKLKHKGKKIDKVIKNKTWEQEVKEEPIEVISEPVVPEVKESVSFNDIVATSKDNEPKEDKLQKQITDIDMRQQYKRILLKLSGESLMGEQGYGIDAQRVADYAEQIKEVVASGTQVAIVIGGGNIFRGLAGAAKGVDRVKGDQMGMLATVINSLALSSSLESHGQPAQVFTAINMFPIGEHYSKWKAIEAMNAGKVAILAGGTGNPFFTTDTGSALRGIEVEADVMLKGTRVDGIYTADPEKDPTATKFSEITYDEIYNRGLKVMDLTATTLCKLNNLPIIVFDMDTKGNLKKVLDGEPIGTLVYEAK